MKKTFRLFVMSALVLTVLGFSAVGVMALTPISSPEVSTAVATLEPRKEVLGVVSTIDAKTITVNGTVYNLATLAEINGTIQVGDTVKLELTTNPDGSQTVDQIGKPDPTSEPTMDATSTEPVSTETPSPDQGTSVDSKGSSLDNSNRSNLNNNNGSSHDTGNGSSQDHGNGSSQDSPNSSGQDSGGGSGNTSGNGGN